MWNTMHCFLCRFDGGLCQSRGERCGFEFGDRYSYDGHIVDYLWNRGGRKSCDSSKEHHNAG